MNPIVDTNNWNEKDDRKIEAIMKKAGYELLVDGYTTKTWALRKFMEKRK